MWRRAVRAASTSYCTKPTTRSFHNLSNTKFHTNHVYGFTSRCFSTHAHFFTPTSGVVKASHEYLTYVSTRFSQKLQDSQPSFPKASQIHITNALSELQQKKFTDALINVHLAMIHCKNGVDVTRLYQITSQILQYLLDSNQSVTFSFSSNGTKSADLVTDYYDACARLTQLRIALAQDKDILSDQNIKALTQFCQIEDSKKASILQSLVYILKGQAMSQQSYSEVAFSQAIQLMPDFVLAYILRAQTRAEEQPEAGLDDFQKAIEIDPTNPLTYARRGSALAALGRITAQLDFDKALELDRTDPQIYLLRAEAYAQDDNSIELALDDYSAAINLNANNLTAYYERAHLLSSIGRLEEALDDVHMMLRLNSRSTDAYYLKATIEEAQDKYLQAKESIDKLIALDPDYPLIWEYRGKVCQDMLADEKEAEKSFKVALTRKSFTFQSLVYLGRIVAENDAEAAIQYFTKAIEIEPNDPVAYTLRGYLYLSSEENLEEALSDYNQAIRIRKEKEMPIDPELQVYRASALIKIGNIGDAIHELEQLLRTKLTLNEKHKCLLHLGLAYSKCERFNEAFELYDKAVQLDATNPAIYFTRGATYRSVERYTESTADLTKAIELKGTNFDPIYYFERALSYLQSGDSKRAIKDLDSAIVLEENFIEAYAQRANAYMEEGEFEKALSDLDKVIALDPEDAVAFMQRGRLHFYFGEANSALEDLNTAISIAPDDPVIYLARARVYAESLDDTRRAFVDLATAISLDSSFVEAFMYRCKYHRIAGNTEKAIEDINKALEIDPNHSQSLFERALIFQENRQFEEALQDLDLSINITPDHQSFAARAHIHSSLENKQAALEDCDNSLHYNPENTDALNLKAFIYLYSIEPDTANYLKALELANRSIEAHAAQPVPYLIRATIYQNTQQIDEARRDISFLKENFPDFIANVEENSAEHSEYAQLLKGLSID